MSQTREPAIIICSFYHLWEVIVQADAVISVLGESDRLLFPDVGSRKVLRLAFDDTNESSQSFVVPNPEQIADLIENFAGALPSGIKPFARGSDDRSGRPWLARQCRTGPPSPDGQSLFPAERRYRPAGRALRGGKSALGAPPIRGQPLDGPADSISDSPEVFGTVSATHVAGDTQFAPASQYLAFLGDPVSRASNYP
jgi:hypothetical protein